MAKTDFDAKLLSLNRKVIVNKTKYLLAKNEFKKIETFDSIYFRGKSHFEEDGTPNYLVFQPRQRYFKIIAGVGNGNHIYYWKSKGLSDERINSIETFFIFQKFFISWHWIRQKCNNFWSRHEFINKD